MLDQWELPGVERVELVGARRHARLGVPGLAGDLHQDLGTRSLTVAITGSLHGDQKRTDLLTELQAKFLAGDPLPFVADIAESSELEDVVIVGFDVTETNDAADGARYRLVLRQYVEPPPPPSLAPELPADVLGSVADLAGGLLDGLDLPNLLGSVPDVADPTVPIRPAMDGVEAAVGAVPDLLGELRTKLGVGP